MKTTKYYFLPFLDHVIAVLISLLFTVFFGSWFTNKIFGTIVGLAMTLVFCGLIYVRLWKLSRQNTRYGYGLKRDAGVKFVLPLALFSLLLTFFYVLAKHGIIPLNEIVLKTYYTFPDNLPRAKVLITSFDYLGVGVRLWFSSFLGFTTKMPVWLMCLSPVLAVLSAHVGFRFGAEHKTILDGALKASDKVKEKFNE